MGAADRERRRLESQAEGVCSPVLTCSFDLPFHYSIILDINQDRLTQRAIEASSAYSRILQAVQAAEDAAGQALQQADHTWAVRPLPSSQPQQERPHCLHLPQPRPTRLSRGLSLHPQTVVRQGLVDRARQLLANSSALEEAVLREQRRLGLGECWAPMGDLGPAGHLSSQGPSAPSHMHAWGCGSPQRGSGWEGFGGGSPAACVSAPGSPAGEPREEQPPARHWLPLRHQLRHRVQGKMVRGLCSADLRATCVPSCAMRTV